jgi:GTPase
LQKDYRSGFVSIIGRPNVGKSTLLNSMMGQKIAIMSDKPQTTRNKIRAVLTGEKSQIVFMDTPGIHKPKHRLGEFMMNVAQNTLREVDMVLYVIEANGGIGAGDEFILDKLNKVKTPVILVINKVDLVPRETVFELIVKFESKAKFLEIIPISALQKNNLDKLEELIIKYLPEGPQYYPDDMVTDHPERFVVSELIREKVLHNTREEIPHSVAVEIEEMKERDNDMVFVKAVIYTERETQKGIIVGKQGSLLKKIGQEARTDIENLLGSKVYLDVWVKVKKDWRNRDSMLRSFGFQTED